MKLSAITSIPLLAVGGVVSLFPARAKRVVFFATLLVRLKGEKKADLETASKLNQVMSLATHEGAVAGTSSLTTMVWHKKTPEQILQVPSLRGLDLSDDNLKGMAQSALENAPAWCRYGTLAEVASDMRKFFENRQTLLGF